MSRAYKTTLAAVVILFLAGTIQAETLWGVTNGTGDAGFWTGGEIFTVDTITGAVTVHQTYGTDQLYAFGDIAVSATGDVYVTYYGADGFDKLALVNTSTWAFDWVQDLGGWNDQVNALEFIDGGLYGVTGGGIPANLLEITLTGSGATVTNLGSLGINSDGDLDVDSNGTVYYTSWQTGSTSEMNTINFAGPSLATSNEILTSSGWAGIAFDSSDNLWMGTYWDQWLYQYDSGTNTALQIHNLGAALGGTITGLSSPIVPVPLASGIGLLGLGVVGLIRRYARQA